MQSQTRIPESLPANVAWVPTPIATAPPPAPAPPARATPPAIAAGLILAIAVATYAAVSQGVSSVQSLQNRRLQLENQALQATAAAARSAKQAYCAGGAQ